MRACNRLMMNRQKIMLKSSVIIEVIIATLLTPTMYVSASVNQEELSEEERESGFYNDTRGSPKYTQDRPAINPDFAPDENCNFAYELHCIPGSQQSCFDLEGFHNGEDNVCSPIKCQEGYHVVDDDETGLCYPNSEADCGDSYIMTYDGEERLDYVFVEGEDGENDRCANPVYLCEDESSHEICREYLGNNKLKFIFF